MFVRINRDVALAGRLDDWNDLLLEASGFNRFCRVPMGFYGKWILLFTRQVSFFSQIFCGDSHMPSTKGVDEGRDHEVDHLRIAHSMTEAEVGGHIATF